MSYMYSSTPEVSAYTPFHFSFAVPLSLKCNGKLKDLAKKETSLTLLQQHRLLSLQSRVSIVGCSYIRFIVTLH